MDFLTVAPETPTETYKCLAVLSLGTGAGSGSRRTSFTGEPEEGGAFSRILSGGRRKSQSEDRRMSHSEDGPLTRILSRRKSQAEGDGGPVTHVLSRRKSEHVEGKGPWYWRCRVGVTKDNLVLLPLANPPNPVLKSRPPPLSSIVQPNQRLGGDVLGHEMVEPTHSPADGIGLGRRLSATFMHKDKDGGGESERGGITGRGYANRGY
ncbi:hypothetical protein CspeluHIS016_0701600 [Cutaneotrichosporon spelunceum]|uniref:Uncharacterized protein n=1 Tax=Cutaneotrichosporon spelunceum TaxID=1672016 RepID=A0AAD3TYB3_9TREE|nr:hypothetical protein CspeluHIS016_0701600 [Cutaneotrichosporon spelunceum]